MPHRSGMRVNSGAFADTLRRLLPISSDCSRQPHRIMIAAQEVYSRKRRTDSTHFNSFGAGASPLSRFSPFRNTAQELHIQCTGLSPQYFPVKYLIVFLLVIIGPVVISAANYLVGERRGNWQTADRSSAGRLPKGLRTSGCPHPGLCRADRSLARHLRRAQLDHRKRARGVPIHSL